MQEDNQYNESIYLIYCMYCKVLRWNLKNLSRGLNPPKLGLN